MKWMYFIISNLSISVSISLPFSLFIYKFNLLLMSISLNVSLNPCFKTNEFMPLCKILELFKNIAYN